MESLAFLGRLATSLSVGTDKMFTVQFQEKNTLHFGARNDVSTSSFFQTKYSMVKGKRHHSFAVPSRSVSEIPEASAFDDFATCVRFVSWLKTSASMISGTPEDLHGFEIALVRWRTTVTLTFRVAKWAQRVKLSRASMIHVRQSCLRLLFDFQTWTSLRKSDFDDVCLKYQAPLLFYCIDFQDGKLKDGFKKQMVP